MFIVLLENLFITVFAATCSQQCTSQLQKDIKQLNTPMTPVSLLNGLMVTVTSQGFVYQSYTKTSAHGHSTMIVTAHIHHIPDVMHH